MTIKEFCEKYAKVNDKVKSQWLSKELNIKDYVSYMDKLLVTTRLADATMWEYDANKERTGKIYVNSVVRYQLFALQIIDLYTDIEIDFSNANEEYDILSRYDLINIISSMVPERELKEFQAILDMRCNDIMTNNYEGHAFVERAIEVIAGMIAAKIPALMEMIGTEN